MEEKENGHILVADDNRMNRMKLSRNLEQQGHTVETAENGVGLRWKRCATPPLTCSYWIS